MQNSKARFLTRMVALGVLLIGAASAYGQVVVPFATTFTSLPVATRGRAEIAGTVTVTTTANVAYPAATATEPAGSYSIGFNFSTAAGDPVPCDNDQSNGIELVRGAGFIAGTATAALAQVLFTSTTGSVTNPGTGCNVTVEVRGATAPIGVTTTGTAQAAGATFTLRGMRLRVDLSSASTAGTAINVSVAASPVTGMTATFTPGAGEVATSAGGRAVVVATSILLTCIGGAPAPAANIAVTEGFARAFAQSATSVGGTAAPAGAFQRPFIGGAISNTRIRLTLAGIPAGVELTWPDLVVGVAAGSGTLQRLAVNLNTDPLQEYEYTTADHVVSDTITEVFNIAPAVTLPTTLATGTATVSVALAPRLATGDATLVTTAPFRVPPAPGFPKPRYNDAGTTATPLLTISQCITNLLFPFVANTAGFNTGIAIANTTKDPFGAQGAAAQSGTCTLNGWKAADGTGVNFTTPSVAAGTTFLTTLAAASNASLNGLTGYIIARCNFQFGHAFAFITDNFGVGDPRVAQGYVALIIPEPGVLGGRFANQLGGVANTGEGLTQ